MVSAKISVGTKLTFHFGGDHAAQRHCAASAPHPLTQCRVLLLLHPDSPSCNGHSLRPDFQRHPHTVAEHDIHIALTIVPNRRWRWQLKDLHASHPLISALAERHYGTDFIHTLGAPPRPNLDERDPVAICGCGCAADRSRRDGTGEGTQWHGAEGSITGLVEESRAGD
jgi:hypothetical protein